MRKHIFVLEHHSDEVIGWPRFLWRLGATSLILLLFTALSLGCGAIGYHLTEKLQWHDAFYDACLVLGEHDVTQHPEKPCGKVFGGLYVMYVRIFFFTAIGLLFVPILHRVLHKLHRERPDRE